MSSVGIEMVASTYPFLRIQVQVLGSSMLKKACQPDPVVSEMRFFPNDHYVVFPSLCVHLQQLLTIEGSR